MRLQPHQVDHVHHPHAQAGQVLAQQRHGGHHLEGGRVARAGEHHVGFAALLVAGPLPDPRAPGAVQDGLVHREPVRGLVLARHDHVDVVAAAQAVVGDREQRVRVRGQVDPGHLGLLVDHVVDEAGVLVGEAVVVLAPHVRGEQVVQRRDRPAPGQPLAGLEPLGVLVEHRVDDVDERLVAGEQAVPAGEQVALQPALAQVLGEHLDHPAVGYEVLVDRQHLGLPLLAGDLVDGVEPVGRGLVRAEEAEVAGLGVAAWSARAGTGRGPGWAPTPTRRGGPRGRR